MIVRPKDPKGLLGRLRERPLVLYGFGGAGKAIAKWCEAQGLSYVFADQDAEKKQALTEVPIVLPERLRDAYGDANVVIASVLYAKEIRERLEKEGVAPSRFLTCRDFMPEVVTWRELEEATEWGRHEGRVKVIAGLVPPHLGSLADYGEGKSMLRRLLPPAMDYYPLDYRKRSEATILCDFDRDPLPAIQTDGAVCTATLVFLHRGEELLAHIAEHTKDTVILSYVTREKVPDREARRMSGYVTDFSEEDIRSLMEGRGFRLEEMLPDPANQIDRIFLFRRTENLFGGDA